MTHGDAVDRRTVLTLLAGSSIGTAFTGCTETAETYDVWGHVDTIVLEAHTSGWIGTEPEAIEDEVNPTIVLYEGNEYDVTVRNGDGEPHSLEIRKDGLSFIDDHRTDIFEEMGTTRTVSIRPDLMIDEYTCGVHTRGEGGMIDVQPENDNDVYEEPD